MSFKRNLSSQLKRFLFLLKYIPFFFVASMVIPHSSSISSPLPPPHFLTHFFAGASLKSLRKDLDTTSMIERGCFENGRTTLHFATQVQHFLFLLLLLLLLLLLPLLLFLLQCNLLILFPQLSLLRGVFILIARGMINRRQKDFSSKSPLDLSTNEMIYQLLGGTRKKPISDDSTMKLLSGRKIELYLDVQCRVTWSSPSDPKDPQAKSQSGWISGITSSYCKCLP
jgi:hypothetical protein